MAAEVKAENSGLEVKTSFGSIKGVPIAALGWVFLALAFGYMVYNQTGSQSNSLEAIAAELPKQTILMQEQSRTLQKILDRH